jgi:mRNA interferase MazF
MTLPTKLKRGDVYWVNLDPTIGSETKKTRPGVIVSNDAQNMVGKHIIIAPVTSVLKKIYPFEVAIVLGDKKSKVMLDQIRTVSCQRLGSKIGPLISHEIEDLDKALKIVLSLG